jgi:hypothetical protein
MSLRRSAQLDRLALSRADDGTVLAAVKRGKQALESFTRCSWDLAPGARSAPHRTAVCRLVLARYKGKTNAGPSAMANDTLINLLAWCKRERERLQMQREMLQSGRFRIFEKDDSNQQRDISNQHIEQIAANISEFDRIIMADYEAKSV